MTSIAAASIAKNLAAAAPSSLFPDPGGPHGRIVEVSEQCLKTEFHGVFHSPRGGGVPYMFLFELEARLLQTAEDSLSEAETNGPTRPSHLRQPPAFREQRRSRGSGCKAHSAAVSPTCASRAFLKVVGSSFSDVQQIESRAQPDGQLSLVVFAGGMCAFPPGRTADSAHEIQLSCIYPISEVHTRRSIEAVCFV